MSEYITVLVTTKDSDQAKKIARKLLEEKLAACCNIVDQIYSMYIWKEELCQEQEALMIIKTRQSLFEKLENTVKSHHSYDVVEIIALPIVSGNSDYLNWVKDSTREI